MQLIKYEPQGLPEIIFKERYAIHPEESWDNASKRVAGHVATGEPAENRQEYTEKFYEEIVLNRFMPAGRIWYGSGRKVAQLNNCVSGETLIHTKRGLVEAKSLQGKVVSILTEDGIYRDAEWQSYGIQELFEVVLSNGDSLFATIDHQWVISGKSERIHTRDLVGKRIPMKSPSTFSYDREEWVRGVQHGLTFGDGTLYMGDKYSRLTQFGDSKHLVMDFFDKYSELDHNDSTMLVVNHLPGSFKSLPENSESLSYIRGFIAGLIGADGHVDSRGHFMLHNKSQSILMGIRKLATVVGVLSTTIKMTREYDPWTGEVSPLYKLTFTKESAFINGALDEKLIIKNKHRENMSKSPLPGKTQTMRVEAVLPTNRAEEVFCCVEPETHTMVIGPGYVTGQCYVISMPEDSREGWAKAIGDTLIISGTGGGVGANMSSVRPRGSKIHGTGGISTGAVSLMQMINAVGDILVGGGGRRLALMLDLNITHPDMPEFLDKKLDRSELTNANISLVLDKRMPPNKWIRAVKEGKDFGLYWKTTEVATANAKEIWEKVVTNAWNSGEPGILNGYLANTENNIAYYKKLVSTNPCGEQFLEEYGSCNLGALVLPNFIGSDGKFDWVQFDKTIQLGVRFLDDVIDVNNYPLPEIRENCLNVRRIGLGIMGLHSLLIKLNYKYSSDSAKAFIDELMHFMKVAAYKASIALAQEKGAFPAYSDEFTESGFVRRALPQKVQSQIRKNGIRNCAIITVAPTGTTSMVANVSSGIEPLFAPAYWRRFYRPTEDGNRQLDKELVVDPLWGELEAQGRDVGVLQGAYDITPEDHLEVQRIVQKHLDSATSKTVNLPQTFEVDSLSELWLEYLPFLKGTTFYRAGSRGEEPLEAIPLETAQTMMALKHMHKDATITDLNSMDCVGGVCEVPEELKPHITEAKYEIAMV